MFSGSFDIWHWLIVLVIVIAIFGTKKLRNAGGDLGTAVRNFKKSMKEGEEEAEAKRDAEALSADEPAEETTTSSAPEAEKATTTQSTSGTTGEASHHEA